MLGATGSRALTGSVDSGWGARGGLPAVDTPDSGGRAEATLGAGNDCGGPARPATTTTSLASGARN